MEQGKTFTKTCLEKWVPGGQRKPSVRLDKLRYMKKNLGNIKEVVEKHFFSVWIDGKIFASVTQVHTRQQAAIVRRAAAICRGPPATAAAAAAAAEGTRAD